MGPDGTVAFPTFGDVGGESRVGVQMRPAGGPLAEVQFLDEAGGIGALPPSVAAGGDGRFVAALVEDGDVKVFTAMPGSATFAPTTTLTTDTADGAAVKADGAGNALVVWSTRDDTVDDRTARVRFTTIPADGSAPTTELQTYITPTSTNPIFYVAFDMNNAGDAVFLRALGTTNDTTTTVQYDAWTRPAGGASTAPEPLITTSYAGDNVDSAGESSLSSLNLDINDGGEIMASWYKSSNPFNTTTVDVVNGTVADGFGAIEHPVDGSTLARTGVESVLDAAGRTTVAVLGEDASFKLRTRVFTRPRNGTWAGPQSPLPTGDHNYGNELAADPTGRVMLSLYTSAATSTIYTALAEPGQDFGTPQPLASGLAGLQRALPAFGASGDGVVAWQFDENAVPVSDAAGYDVSPPQLRSLTIPASGTAGTPLDFSVQPFDIWSPVTTSWNFDGVASDGASQSHVFGDAGDKAVSVTATDSLGNAASANGTVAVTAAPTPPPSTSPVIPVPSDLVAPLVSNYAFSPARFAVGPKATALTAARRAPRGTKIRFRLNEAGTVAITIARQVPGLRSRGRCVVAKRPVKRKPLRCKAFKRMGTLRRRGASRLNSVAFSGRLGKRALPVGRYRATLVATDAAGNRSKAASTRFRIVPRG